MRNLLIGLGVGYSVRAVRSSLLYKAAVQGNEKAKAELEDKFLLKLNEFMWGESHKDLRKSNLTYMSSAFTPAPSFRRYGDGPSRVKHGL